MLKRRKRDVERRKTIGRTPQNSETLETRALEMVDVDDIEPQEFWDRFVSQRKPVVLTGHPRDAEWKVHQRWSDEYLERKAGKDSVQVEFRDDNTQQFGRGRKTKMPFAKALDRLGKGDALLYMTTQDAPIGPDDHPEVLAPPLSHLATDFPLRPRLMGSLVPQQINIWAGVAGAVGSSSGLHHDYHDNLYIVIRGRKRFRLFPPSLLPCMYTNGQPIKIYDNGRIVYNGQRDVLADGSDADDVRLWKARRRAEAQLEAAEEASRRREPFSDEMLAKAEEDLDQVMEDIMERWQLLRKEDRRKKTGRASDSQSQDHEPESFSRIDLSLPEDEMNRCFPLFPGASAALECEVKAGQMLYLPAGWFHEVTSFRDDTHQANGSSMHLALNYWFHPPDNLQAGEKGFSHPYTSEYWPELWESRKCRYETKFAALKRKGELIRGAHAHFLDGIRGLFGYGRRQHLHRFVNVHFKKRNKTQ